MFQLDQGNCRQACPLRKDQLLMACMWVKQTGVRHADETGAHCSPVDMSLCAHESVSV